MKTAHAKFPKAYIQNIMKTVPTGAHILLTTFHEGVYLCALGYTFSKKEKVSMMIFTRGACTAKTIDSHYYQRRNDPFGNVYDKVVKCPEIAKSTCKIVENLSWERYLIVLVRYVRIFDWNEKKILYRSVPCLLRTAVHLLKINLRAI